MNKLEKVIVSWFDELKGIGEGKTTNGRVIFLNSKAIEQDGRFLNLKPNEEIRCEIHKNESGYFAVKISRTLGEKLKVEKSTFLELSNLA